MLDAHQRSVKKPLLFRSGFFTSVNEDTNADQVSANSFSIN
jgi:hypothetical protein